MEDEDTAVVPGVATLGYGKIRGGFFPPVAANSGPWLAISGGGSDGAYGGGVLAGWTQAGNRPNSPW